MTAVRVRGRGRSLWRSARWPSMTALLCAALVLGWIGFDRSMAALGQSGSFLDKLYLTIQLFVLQSGAVPPPIPWQLDVARFLAPAVAAYAALIAVAVVFAQQVSAMRARRASGHVVVCGLGRLGATLARTLGAAGYVVVAVESDPQNAAIGECREEGITVLIGDATDRTLLRATGVQRARYLFAVTGIDGVNAEIATDARRLVEKRVGPPLTCFVHISDDKLGGVLRQLGVAMRGGGDTFRLEYFNAAQRGAPALLREHPAFDDDGTSPLGPPHMLVIGLGEMGSNLVVRAARRWRSIPGTRGRRFRVTVVDDKADDHAAALDERFPRLKDACEVVALRVDLRSAEFERADFLFGPDGACPVTSAYVCVGDDAAGLSAALHLRRRLGDRDVPIVVRTTQQGGVARLLAGDDHEAGTGLEVFGLLDVVCRPDVLLKGQNEVLAEAVHEDYVRRRREAGATPETDPSVAAWDALPETLKESNRRQAADIGRKLEAIGCDIEPSTDWDAPLASFSAGEVELLARMEHDGWQAERTTAGWKYGPEKDVGQKKSPYLVSYDALPETIRDLDRDTVRAIPSFLAGAGFAVVRPRTVGRDTA